MHEHRRQERRTDIPPRLRTVGELLLPDLSSAAQNHSRKWRSPICLQPHAFALFVFWRHAPPWNRFGLNPVLKKEVHPPHRSLGQSAIPFAGVATPFVVLNMDWQKRLHSRRIEGAPLCPTSAYHIVCEVVFAQLIHGDAEMCTGSWHGLP